MTDLLRRVAFFLALCAPLTLLFGRVLASILNLSLHDERYTHLLIVPCITFVLIVLKGKCFKSVRYWWLGGLSFFIVSLAIYVCTHLLPSSFGQAWIQSLEVFALVLTWITAFATCFGYGALKAVAFPLGFLFLFIPLPPQVVEVAESIMQHASAELSYIFIKFSRMPVFYEGSKFHLPGIDIEVARECSGIRSSIGLMIAALLLGYLFLSSPWKRFWFAVLTIPIVIFKNSLRIAVLSWLGVNVSPEILRGPLHHHGGPLFALIAFMIQVPILFALQKLDRPSGYRLSKT